MARKNRVFWSERLTWDTPQFACFLFYLLKREICNLANCFSGANIFQSTMHVVCVHDFVVHISVLFTKTNICAHHKRFIMCEFVSSFSICWMCETHCFKTLYKNMQNGCFRQNLIFVYIKYLNPLHNIFTQHNGTVRRCVVSIWMQDVQLFVHKKK